MKTHCTRELQLDASRADPKRRSVPAVISSTYPVPRNGYNEVLLHGRENVDLSRAPLPLIESHDGARLNVGIVENLRLAGDKLRFKLREPLALRVFNFTMAALLAATALWIVVDEFLPAA